MALISTAGAFAALALAVGDLPADSAPAALAAEQPIDLRLGLLMRDQHWAEALALLQAQPDEVRRSPDAMFIEAFLLRRTGAPRRAADLYQRMLTDNDRLLRVRLELAQTYLELSDDRAAELNFRLALSGDLPPAARQRVETVLAEIETRRRWRFTVGLGVAPDSNVNAATDAQRAQILGLPFDLSRDARRRSGVSANLAVGADRTVPIRAGLGVQIGAYGRLTDNPGRAFDDGALGLHLGPQIMVGRTRLTVQATGDRRWFGGAPYLWTYGGEVEVFRPLGARTVLRGAARITRLSYDQRPDRDATSYALDVERTRYLSPTRFWTASATVQRVESGADSESYVLGRLAVGLYQTLPRGFSVYVEPEAVWREHDARDFLFGARRSDREIGLSARLLKRDWSWWGFSPYVGGQIVHNDSSLTIQRYDRSRFEFGVTRTF